jgi:hypothetical protein
MVARPPLPPPRPPAPLALPPPYHVIVGVRPPPLLPRSSPLPLVVCQAMSWSPLHRRPRPTLLRSPVRSSLAPPPDPGLPTPDLPWLLALVIERLHAMVVWDVTGGRWMWHHHHQIRPPQSQPLLDLAPHHQPCQRPSFTVPLDFWSPDAAPTGGSRRGTRAVWQCNVGDRRGGGGCADSVSGVDQGRDLASRLRGLRLFVGDLSPFPSLSLQMLSLVHG